MPKVTEFWKDIPGYEGLYQASTEGQIRSLRRWVVYKGAKCKGRWHEGKVLKPGNTGNYLMVDLSRNGCAVYRSVASLVLLTFVGPKPDGMECCHNNGNGKDNSYWNLRYGTHIENEADKEVHGTRSHFGPSGDANGGSKLTDQQVIEIRSLPKPGYGYKVKWMMYLAKKYSVSYQNIQGVIYETTRKTPHASQTV